MRFLEAVQEILYCGGIPQTTASGSDMAAVQFLSNSVQAEALTVKLTNQWGNGSVILGNPGLEDGQPFASGRTWVRVA